MQIETELGKIYCRYNESIDDYDVKRVVKTVKDESNNNIITIIDCDSNTYKFDDSSKKYDYTEDEYKEFRKEWIELKSDGIISKSNVLSVSAEEFGRDVKDVILIFFPNNKVINIPDTEDFRVIARQGITNIYAEMAGYNDVVGVSISIDNIPSGYALSDFIENSKVINSSLMHFYKIDDDYSVNYIIDSDDTETIFKDLYDSRVHYYENTDNTFIAPINNEDACISGYCSSLKRFLKETEFIKDVKSIIGIVKIDFELKANTPISEEDKVLLMTLCGGIKINKAVPLEFDYTIDLKLIKMRYILVEDKNNDLFIVPYTELPTEIDPLVYYKINEERVNSIHDRLAKLASGYIQK